MTMAAALVATARTAAAQESVVLSGGAARGVAHIGALIGLERLGYDPDLVVGNSMGAVVGALYAAGYFPEEIERLASSVDWGDLFMPEPLVLGADRTVRFPMIRVGIDASAPEITRGFIPDWRVNRLLVRLLFDAGARAGGDFDRLPRRYRAMAADMVDGTEVTLARGDLALAVRASMAAPIFFSPVEWGGRLIADGGIVNYLPISVARAEGASPIIAVDVSRPRPRLGRRDPVALGGRALGLLLHNALPDSVPDFLIVPDIDPDFSGVQFTGVAGLIRLGLDAVLDTLPPAGSGPPAPRPPHPPPDRLGALAVVGTDAALKALTRRVFREAAPAPYDPERVVEAVERLYATGLVSGVWPRVENPPAPDAPDVETAAPTLTVRVDAAPRLTLDAAAAYENDRGGRAWGRVSGRGGFAGGPAELALSGSVTGLERWGALSLKRHSLLLPPLAWTLGAYYQEREVRLFGPGGLDEVDVQRGGAWLGLELPHAFPDRVLSAVVRVERIDLPGTEDGFSMGPQLRLAAPRGRERRVGVAPEAEAELRFGDAAYTHAAARGSLAAEWRVWAAAAVLDVATVGGGAPADVQPALGDGQLMPGLRWGQVRGRSRVVTGVDLARPLPFQGTLRLRLRAGAAADDPDAFLDREHWLTGAALEVLWNAPVGLVLVGVGASSGGESRLEVNLGPRF